MLDRSNPKRVIFPKGKQQTFINAAIERVEASTLARACNVSPRTLRDWKREKFRIDELSLVTICRAAKLRRPRGITMQSRYAHTSAAGKGGGEAVVRKYGHLPFDESRRRERWITWWKRDGSRTSRFGKFTQPRTVHIPPRSKSLAEFIGIMLGDGGLTPYQATITLHHIDDLPYSTFVTRQIERLFDVKPAKYHRPHESVYRIVVSRRNVVHFLHDEGLPLGNKVRQQCDIPAWILNNTPYARACVRGLVDTDGSIYQHRYRSKDTQYSYTKLSSTNYSRPLLRTVAQIMKGAGLHARFTNHDVRLDSQEDLARYLKLFGTHNPKHLKRCRK